MASKEQVLLRHSLDEDSRRRREDAQRQAAADQAGYSLQSQQMAEAARANLAQQQAAQQGQVQGQLAEQQFGHQQQLGQQRFGQQTQLADQGFGHQQQLSTQQAEQQRQRDYLLNHFQEGRDWREFGFQTERDYRNAIYQAAHSEQQFGHQQQLSNQQFGQQSQLSAQGAQQQGQLQQQHTDLQGQLNAVQLVQGEQMRMQRLREGIAAVRANPDLSDMERGHLITQMQTGLDPLQQRQHQSQMLTQQLQRQALEQHMQQQAAHEQTLADFRAQTAQGRVHRVQTSDGRTVEYMQTSPDGRLEMMRDPDQAADRAIERARQQEEQRNMQAHQRLVGHMNDQVNREYQAHVANLERWRAIPTNPQGVRVDRVTNRPIDEPTRPGFLMGDAQRGNNGEWLPGSIKPLHQMEPEEIQGHLRREANRRIESYYQDHPEAVRPQPRQQGQRPLGGVGGAGGVVGAGGFVGGVGGVVGGGGNGAPAPVNPPVNVEEEFRRHMENIAQRPQPQQPPPAPAALQAQEEARVAARTRWAEHLHRLHPEWDNAHIQSFMNRPGRDRWPANQGGPPQ